MAKPGAGIDWLPWLGARAAELQSSVLFLTRLPFPRGKPAGGASLAQAAWAFPIAGVLVGAVGAVLYALVHRVGVPAWPAAALAVAAKPHSARLWCSPASAVHPADYGASLSHTLRRRSAIGPCAGILLRGRTIAHRLALER